MASGESAVEISAGEAGRLVASVFAAAMRRQASRRRDDALRYERHAALARDSAAYYEGTAAAIEDGSIGRDALVGLVGGLVGFPDGEPPTPINFDDRDGARE